MNEFTCDRCGKIFTKEKYVRHLSRKSPCRKNKKEKNKEEKKDKIKAISLFSGMGGDSLGIHMAGLELIAYSEWEKEMIETHTKLER